MSYFDGMTASAYREEDGTYYFIAGRRSYRFKTVHDYERSRAALGNIFGANFVMVPVVIICSRYAGYGWAALIALAWITAFIIWFVVFGQALLTVNAVPEQVEDSAKDRFDRTSRQYGKPVLWAGMIVGALLTAGGLAIALSDPADRLMGAAVTLFFAACTAVSAVMLRRAARSEREGAGYTNHSASSSPPSSSQSVSAPAVSPAPESAVAHQTDEPGRGSEHSAKPTPIAPASMHLNTSSPPTIHRDPIVPWLIGGVVAAIVLIGGAYAWISRPDGSAVPEDVATLADASADQSDGASQVADAGGDNPGSFELAASDRPLKVLLRGAPWPEGAQFTLGELDDYFSSVDNVEVKQWMRQEHGLTLWSIAQMPDGPFEILLTFGAPRGDGTISVDTVSTDGVTRNSERTMLFATDLAKGMERQRLGKLIAAAQGAAMPVPAFSTAVWRKGAQSTGHCQVRVGKIPVMDAPCSGTGDGDTLIVSTYGNGCSVNLTRSGDAVSGTLAAVRGICWIDEANELEVQGDIPLHSLHYVDGCWVNDQARICLRPGR